MGGLHTCYHRRMTFPIHPQHLTVLAAPGILLHAFLGTADLRPCARRSQLKPSCLAANILLWQHPVQSMVM